MSTTADIFTWLIIIDKLLFISGAPPTDNILAKVIICRIRGNCKINVTVL